MISNSCSALAWISAIRRPAAVMLAANAGRSSRKPEATAGIEPAIGVLQTPALATWLRRLGAAAEPANWLGAATTATRSRVVPRVRRRVARRATYGAVSLSSLRAISPWRSNCILSRDDPHRRSGRTGRLSVHQPRDHPHQHRGLR